MAVETEAGGAAQPPGPDAGGGPGSGWLLGAEERRVARISLTVLGVLSTGSLTGVAFSLYLVNHYPLLLVGLSPLGRHLWLVAPSVDPLAFALVVTARRLLFYLASFHLGRALGPNGIVWIEGRSVWFGRFVRWLERLFARASYAVVLFLSGPTVSALAGISGMRQRVFVTLATLCTVARIVVVIFFAEALRQYIEVVLAWIDRNWIPGTVVMVALVSIYRWRNRGRLPIPTP